MGWTNTNGSNDTTWDNTIPWDYASLQVDNKYASWESVIKVANAAGKDAWICVPHMVDDDYIENLALLFRDGSDTVEPLDQDLKLYIEYSNEIWNWGGDYTQTTWVYDEASTYGDPLNFDGSTDDATLMYRYKAMRSVQISTVFREVFGDDQMMSRIRPVICWQQAYNDLTSRTLNFIDRYYNKRDPASDWSDPHPVNYYFYGAGGSGYWYHEDTDTLTEDNIWDSYTWNSETYGEKLYSDATWARSYGLTYLAYEGDNHPLFDGDVDIYYNIHWNEEMYQTTVDHLEAYSKIGGKSFYFLVLSTDDEDTIWGIYNNDYGLSSSPQHRAILAQAEQGVSKVSTTRVAPFSSPGMAYDTLTYNDPNTSAETGSLSLTAGTDVYSSSYAFSVDESATFTLTVDYTALSASTLILDYGGDEIGSFDVEVGEGTTSELQITASKNELNSIRVICSEGSVEIDQISVLE